MEKAVWKAAVNRKVNNCVYNWTSDRKTGRFATANKVKSVTSHEVINNNIGLKYWINESDRTKEAVIRRAVEEAVDGFAYWQRTKIGRDINPSMLSHLMIQAGAKRVEIREPAFTEVGDTGLATMAGREVAYGGLERD